MPSSAPDASTGRRRPGSALAIAALYVIAAACGALEGPAPAVKPEAGTIILEAGKTFWRYYEAWQNDVVRQDSGELVNVDLTRPVQGKDAKGQPMPDSMAGRDYWEPRKGQTGIRPATRTIGAPLPVDGWEQPAFDDSTWTRDLAVQRQTYRAIHSMYLRGKFEVTDPAQASDLHLTLGFRGGVVVFLNGTEVARGFLPDGKVEATTLAKEYPKNAYLKASGELIDQTEWGTAQTYIPENNLMVRVKNEKDTNGNQSFFDEASVANYKQRYRNLEATIPAAKLRKGLNVLAVLIRRSPADIAMYTAPWPKPKYFDQVQWYYSLAWNRCDLDDLRLSATGKADGIVPNIAPPKGPRVWAHAPIHQPLHPGWFAEPNEGVGSVRLQGLRNGVYSGEIVASASTNETIKDLKAEASDLKGPGGASIPASAITIGYAQPADYVYWGQFDTLVRSAPAEIKTTTWRWRYGSREKGAIADFPPIQPIWVSVKVSKTAAPGDYAGTVTVTMAGQKPAAVPLTVKIMGDYALPDPQDSVSYVGLLESPDALAGRYKIPLWSEEHWKMIDQTFALLGELGNKEIYVPIIGRTHLDNAESMVRWIKQADGTYTHDYTIAEKYVDIALKHLKNIRMVCVVAWWLNSPEKRSYKSYTEFDPKTGAVTEKEAPDWGTPEAKVFWKPVMEGMRQMLAKKGLDKAMMFGLTTDGIDKSCWDDIGTMFPDVKWTVRSHQHPGVWWGGKWKDRIGQESCMFGSTLGVGWDPDQWRPANFGWRVSPFPGTIYPAYARNKDNREFNQGSTVAKYRTCVEGPILTPCGASTYQGIGSYGGDFWFNSRYDASMPDTLCSRIRWMIGADKDGPVHTPRSRMMQESLQDAELRIYLEDVLADKEKAAKLGADLAVRSRAVLDDRTRLFCYLSMFYELPLNTSDPNGNSICTKGLPTGWDDSTTRLCLMADEVARALAK